MLVSFVGNPLVNLITEAQNVMFNTEVSNHLQLISGENLQDGNCSLFFIISSQQVFLRYNHTVMYPYLPKRVVGGVDDDSLCLRVEFTGKLI